MAACVRAPRARAERRCRLQCRCTAKPAHSRRYVQWRAAIPMALLVDVHKQAIAAQTVMSQQNANQLRNQRADLAAGAPAVSVAELAVTLPLVALTVAASVCNKLLQRAQQARRNAAQPLLTAQSSHTRAVDPHSFMQRALLEPSEGDAASDAALSDANIAASAEDNWGKESMRRAQQQYEGFLRRIQTNQ